jgi:hypothetical protein
MEDNLKKNRRQPQKKWKTTSKKNGRRPLKKNGRQLKTILNNGRQPQAQLKKSTLIASDIIVN